MGSVRQAGFWLILALRASHASAATQGTCPFPMALSRSTRLATPLATRPIPGSMPQISRRRFALAQSASPSLVSAGSPAYQRGHDPGNLMLEVLASSDVPSLGLEASRHIPDCVDCLCAPCGPEPSVLSNMLLHWPVKDCFWSANCSRHTLLQPCKLEWAKIQIRSRLCGAPALCAPNTPHSASYPISAKSPRTTCNPRLVSSGEFSTKTYRGPTSRMILANSFHKPERAPVIPFPLPAALMSWQGNPPQIASTFPRQGFPSKVVTSSQIGNRGNIPSRWRCNKTFRQ